MVKTLEKFTSEQSGNEGGDDEGRRDERLEAPGPVLRELDQSEGSIPVT